MLFTILAKKNLITKKINYEVGDYQYFKYKEVGVLKVIKTIRWPYHVIVWSHQSDTVYKTNGDYRLEIDQ